MIETFNQAELLGHADRAGGAGLAFQSGQSLEVMGGAGVEVDDRLVVNIELTVPNHGSEAVGFAHHPAEAVRESELRPLERAIANAAFQGVAERLERQVRRRFRRECDLCRRGSQADAFYQRRFGNLVGQVGRVAGIPQDGKSFRVELGCA